MFTFNQELLIDYSIHGLFIVIGVILLYFTRSRHPQFSIFPRRENLKLFGITAALFLLIEILFSEFGVQSIYSYVSNFGLFPVILKLGFEGIFVGWSEEYLFRGSIQRILNAHFQSVKVVRMNLGTLLTAFIFGLMHLGNLFLGQSLNSTLFQIAFAVFFGIVIGIFYDRTNDLSGAAWIHNMVDFTGTVFQFIPL